MKADATGTPTEQARARQGWRNAAAAHQAGRHLNKRCVACRWVEYTAARTTRYRCDAGAFATTAQAVCDEWQPKPAEPTPAQREAATRAHLRAVERALADPATDPREIGSLKAQQHQLRQQLQAAETTPPTSA